MKIRLFAIVALVALGFSGGAALAQPSPDCFTGSLLGGPFIDADGNPYEVCWAPAPAGLSSPGPSPVADPVDPVPVDPVDPVEPVEPTPSVPSTPLTPPIERPGAIDVDLRGTVMEGFPPGKYTQIFTPVIPELGWGGGVVDAIVYPNGTAKVWL